MDIAWPPAGGRTATSAKNSGARIKIMNISLDGLFTCGFLKALTCAVDFIKIDCRSSLHIYASPKKLRCEPESSIDRPGAPGRCPRAGNSLPVSKRMPSGTTNSRVLRPVRAAPEPRAGTHAADGRGIQPRPSRSRPRDSAPSPRKISTAPYSPGLI